MNAGDGHVSPRDGSSLRSGLGRVIVVGGGVIGTACAYYLSRSGWQVSVVDQGQFGRGCSHANCGYVCPSHVLPLAAPGAIGMALRSLFTRNSPFRIKPRFDLSLWQWLYHFARRCNRRDMLQAGHAIQALLNSSRRLYDELLRSEPIDCEWETKGLLFVFQSQQGMDHYAHTAEMLRAEFNMPAVRHDHTALAELEPALKPGLAGGWLYPGDAHLRPDRLMTSWRRVLESRSVTIRESCAVRGFVNEPGRARALATSQGELPAEAFVVATGAWTPLLARQLGCPMPIQPGKGYSITMPRPARCPTYPMIFEEHRVAVTPMRTGYRLGSTMEFAGYDSTLNRRRLAILRDGASHYLHEPVAEPVEEEWFGWRPMTYDSVPIIDRCPTMPNVIVAAGHNMLGLSMAPATGKLVAELLGTRAPHIDPGPYRAARFANS
jgi:D-amino-acid dehydrogenase